MKLHCLLRGHNDEASTIVGFEAPDQMTTRELLHRCTFDPPALIPVRTCRRCGEKRVQPAATDWPLHDLEHLLHTPAPPQETR